MNDELISIIVPVYKVEKYLERCVNSILLQTYKNLEIILVDDGSPDDSGKMCEELAKTDSRIVVYHKENGGLSDARNFGVEKARGKYIGFVDSDDYIHENMYQHLYETIKTNNIDIAECNVTRVYGNKEKPHYAGEEFCNILRVDEYIKEYLSMEKVYGSVWCKLISSDIAKKLKFPVGKYYEDMFYNYDLFKVIDKIAITSKCYYYYYIRENSITTEKYSSKQIDIIEILNTINDYILKEYPQFSEESFIRLTYAYLSTFNHLIVDNNYKNYPEFIELREYFKNNFSKILKSSKAAKELKISVLILNVNIKLYRYLYKKYKSRTILNK
ncbi:glycosyltransferase [Gemella sp. zg-570]|uniref:glycosyltransferase n=1 Tax=Gemella sp. zg-570 TaxID=2840371 RepID=UPI001C0C8560|nr:glycosyltransferase [Gemella sp. zg-570]QWQ39040.1 glycosyltransferase [Gemella sp. zg-570]